MSMREQPGIIGSENKLRNFLLKCKVTRGLDLLDSNPLSLLFLSVLAFLLGSVFIFVIIIGLGFPQYESIGTFSDIFGAVGGAVIALSGAIVAVVLANKSIVVTNRTNDIAREQGDIEIHIANNELRDRISEIHYESLSPLFAAKENFNRLMYEISELSVHLSELRGSGLGGDLPDAKVGEIEKRIEKVSLGLSKLNSNMDAIELSNVCDAFLRFRSRRPYEWMFAAPWTNRTDEEKRSIQSYSPYSSENISNTSSASDSIVRREVIGCLPHLLSMPNEEFIEKIVNSLDSNIEPERREDEEHQLHHEQSIENILEIKLQNQISELVSEKLQGSLITYSEKSELESVVQSLAAFEENINSRSAKEVYESYLNYFDSIKERVCFDVDTWFGYALGDTKKVITEFNRLEGEAVGYFPRSSYRVESQISSSFKLDDRIATVFALGGAFCAERSDVKFFGGLVKDLIDTTSGSGLRATIGSEVFLKLLGRLRELEASLQENISDLNKDLTFGDGETKPKNNFLSEVNAELRVLIGVLSASGEEEDLSFIDYLYKDFYFVHGAISLVMLSEWFGETKSFRSNDGNVDSFLEESGFDGVTAACLQGLREDRGFSLDKHETVIAELCEASLRKMSKPSSTVSSRVSRRFLAALINDPRAIFVGVERKLSG